MPLFAETADIVDMKDQKTYRGKITEEDSASLFIRLDGGSIIHLQRSAIAKIRLHVDYAPRGANTSFTNLGTTLGAPASKKRSHGL